jgi:hypothetical protein
MILPDQFIDSAARDETPLHDNADPITDHLHIVQNVRAEKDRFPAIAQTQNQIADLLASDRIQSGHRLIEDNQFRIVDQRLRQADTLQHAFGEFSQLPGTCLREPTSPNRSVTRWLMAARFKPANCP